MPYVYLLHNEETGKQYVGKTVSKRLCTRWGNHLASMRKGSPTYLHKSMRKYGPTAFRMTVLARLDNPELTSEAEKLFIVELGTRAPNGYNLTDGGEGTVGRIHSPETRARIRANHPRNWVGKKHTEDTKQKMREAASQRQRQANGSFV